ncbi:XdhC family protein [Mucilaginibacter sp. HMF5004]|uniref:XdhC family protein n=1 Tax=Mucilaginibacter rivuli TaxID=2857527 RepID=UPI001C5EF734|nr:XdhC/CoxI family protein [Mucilaginibacter rivuli]MBW4889071.1 XdhC family protein [Mucilaginibacter rivuli]
MKELKDIVKAYDTALKTGKQTALATVVLVEGSAYRRAGARMLITEDGELTGAISGGCLEGDALRKARLAMAHQQPMLVTYDTMDDDDAKLGVGLGCNGIIHILIEPVHNAQPNNPLALIKSVLSKRQNAVLVTIFSLQDRKADQPGTCYMLTDDEQIQSTVRDASFKSTINKDATEVLNQGVSKTKTYTAGVEYTGFVELIKPAVSLVIIGAGNDAIPLTQMAAILGWETTVVDGRPNYALAERFPQATRVLVAKPEQVCAQLTFDEHTVMVLMTHNYNYELALLKQILPLNLPYLGILGPKKKLERMLGELEDSGTTITDQHLKSIYGPVGLDIGSEGAEEIALSVIAEIKAVLSQRNGLSLKYKSATIHAISQ